MNKPVVKALLIVLVFITIGAYLLCRAVPAFSFTVLMAGNVFLFALSTIAYLIVERSFKDRPQAFVRGVMSGMMLRMFACILAVVIYAVLARPHLYKPQLFVLMGIYAIYSAVETIMLSRMARTIR